MLMGALFADAMGRDMLPGLYPESPKEAVAAYARLFMRAIGLRKTPAAADSPDHSSSDQQ
jgi:hypothetical protein